MGKIKKIAMRNNLRSYQCMLYPYVRYRPIGVPWVGWYRYFISENYRKTINTRKWGRAMYKMCHGIGPAPSPRMRKLLKEIQNARARL